MSTIDTANLVALCAQHRKPFCYFDERCNKPICVECAALNHNGHTCVSMDEAAAKCRTARSDQLVENRRPWDALGIAQVLACPGGGQTERWRWR